MRGADGGEVEGGEKVMGFGSTGVGGSSQRVLWGLKSFCRGIMPMNLSLPDQSMSDRNSSQRIHDFGGDRLAATLLHNHRFRTILSKIKVLLFYLDVKMS